MLEDFGDGALLEKLRRKLLYLCMRRGLRKADAEDIAQSALTAYFESHDRYGPEENHGAILHGILRNKVREFFDRTRREREGLARCATRPDVAREHPMLAPNRDQAAAVGGLEEVLGRESGRQILEALSKLPPRVRKLILQLADCGRAGVVARSGENKNTVDTRIHTARQQFRALLESHGYWI